MMTEKAAKEKWCPLTQTHPSQEASRCLGSGCMMWRSEMADETHESTIDFPRAKANGWDEHSKPPAAAFEPPKGEGWATNAYAYKTLGAWRLNFTRPTIMIYGWCGLAGQP